MKERKKKEQLQFYKFIKHAQVSACQILWKLISSIHSLRTLTNSAQIPSPHSHPCVWVGLTPPTALMGHMLTNIPCHLPVIDSGTSIWANVNEWDRGNHRLLCRTLWRWLPFPRTLQHGSVMCEALEESLLGAAMGPLHIWGGCHHWKKQHTQRQKLHSCWHIVSHCIPLHLNQTLHLNFSVRWTNRFQLSTRQRGLAVQSLTTKTISQLIMVQGILYAKSLSCSFLLLLLFFVYFEDFILMKNGEVKKNPQECFFLGLKEL